MSINNKEKSKHDEPVPLESLDRSTERTIEKRPPEAPPRVQGPQSKDFASSIDSFMSLIDELSLRYSRSKTSMIKNLIDNTCDYRTRYEIQSSTYHNSEQKFDSYFTLKHEFEKNRFVQTLCSKLRDRGLQACITTEEKHPVGVFDVLITNNKFLLMVSNRKGKNIVVEWKAGASFSLSQLERYLWACDVLVLVRVPFNQVVRIARGDIERYLTWSVSALSERAVVIDSDERLQKVPGQYCKGCPVQECEFFKHDPAGKIVAFNSDSMRDDMLSMFRNLDRCIEQAIDVVMKELLS